MHILHEFIDRETGRALTGRVFLVSLEIFRDLGDRPVLDIGVVYEPVPVRVRRDIGPLKWIGAQVVKLGDAKFGESA